MFIVFVVFIGKFSVCGVCVYNFKNVDIDIFCDFFVVFIGLFGLGKLSFVFDMIFVEG